MGNTYKPLYQTIYKDISNDIHNGVLLPGDKLDTEFEMMEKYGVSRITVSRALQELVRDGFVTRYRSKGSFVKEQNHHAENNKPEQGVSSTIAFVMPFSTGTVPQLLFAMQHAAQKQNLLLSIFNSEKNLEQERDILKRLAELPFAGIIFYPIESYDNLSYFSPFILRNTPLVSIDKTIPYADVPCIKCDNYLCAYKMTQYLIDKGHTNIAFYAHTLKDENEKQRFLGYLNALVDNGISPNSDFFLELEKDCQPQNMMPESNSILNETVKSQLQQMFLLKERPTALFCAFDLIAAYIQQQAGHLGISIPDDLSVVGFDNLPVCDHLQVPLTSVAQDFVSIGNKAVELISQKINGERTDSCYMFDGNIIERSSVKDITVSEN